MTVTEKYDLTNLSLSFFLYLSDMDVQKDKKLKFLFIKTTKRTTNQPLIVRLTHFCYYFFSVHLLFPTLNSIVYSWFMNKALFVVKGKLTIARSISIYKSAYYMFLNLLL